jgi:hypothetical protein
MTDKQITRWQRNHDNFENGVISTYKQRKYASEIMLAYAFCSKVNALLTNEKILYLADIRQGYSWKDECRAVFGWLVVRSDCGGCFCFSEQFKHLPSRSAKQVAKEINSRFKYRTMDISK